MKPLATKKKKEERERSVLLGLVELYLETGKPVSSNALKERGFEDLSSATIRNYFVKLETAGYLHQQHSSGGRIPKELAFRLYAHTYLHDKAEATGPSFTQETREVASYLQQVADTISLESGCGVFLSAPRFDRDFVLDSKLVKIDDHRLLCALITDFGRVYTELLPLDKALSNTSLENIELYFRSRLRGGQKPSLEKEEEELFEALYKEVMLRHIVKYTNFHAEDIYKTGFSKLLNSSDFQDTSSLANTLALFENPAHLRALLDRCDKENNLCCWIGSDLAPISPTLSACTVITIPYRIHQTNVGVIALLGPHRLPYRKLFALLRSASEQVSESLTKSLYTFKISYRRPQSSQIDFKSESPSFVDQAGKLLEKKEL